MSVTIVDNGEEYDVIDYVAAHLAERGIAHPCHEHENWELFSDKTWEDVSRVEAEVSRDEDASKQEIHYMVKEIEGKVTVMLAPVYHFEVDKRALGDFLLYLDRLPVDSTKSFDKLRRNFM